MRVEDKSYLKSIATLVSGSVIAQAFTVVCAPILTRLYSPEALGVYSLVTGAVTMFGAIMSLRYEMCIVSEPSEKKIYPLIKVSFFTCCILSIIISVGYCIYFGEIGFSTTALVLGIITGILVFLMGIINIVTSYNNRYKDYTLITKTYVKRVISQNICNIIAGFLSFGSIGLSVSQVIGYTAGVYGQAKPLLKHKSEVLDSTKTEVQEVLVENIKQVSFATPAALANGLSYSLISYFIQALFNTAIVGYYSMSFRILGLPISLISTNVSKVFLEKASREYEMKGNFKHTYLGTLGASTIISIPLGLVLALLAPVACEFFFGSGWGVAGNYIRILTPMFMLRFIAGCVSSAAIIVKKQQIDFWIQLLATIFTIVVFIMAKRFSFGIDDYLALLNIGFCIIYILYIFLFWICAKNDTKK